MASRQQLEERQARKEARRERSLGHLTIGEAAERLGVEYERARELIVVEGRVPHQVISAGGKLSPKYLIPEEAFETFLNVSRPRGRPRVGDRRAAERSEVLWRSMYGDAPHPTSEGAPKTSESPSAAPGAPGGSE